MDMSIVPDTGRTLANLLTDLGSIPLRRIRALPPIGLATERDLIRALNRKDRLLELVDGCLVEKAIGWAESAIGGELFAHVAAFVDRLDLGVVTPANGPVRLKKGLIRLPDVAYYGWQRFPGRKMPVAPIPSLTPDLAVTVVRSGNTKKEIDRKLREYFLAGTRLAWVIDPKKRTARVHVKPDEFTPLDEAGRLDGGDVLPGFSVALRDLFAVVGEPEPAPKRPSRKGRGGKS
jgi:Uma2 family endonuclease